MKEVLVPDGILLNLPVMTKQEAIKKAGQTLVNLNYVTSDYIECMFDREKEIETYLGNHIAIPHGTNESKQFIKNSGIVLLQFKHAIDYGEEKVHLVLGIAGEGNKHLEILSKIAICLLDQDNLAQIINSNSKQEILKIINEGEI